MKILTVSNCPLVESQGSGYVIVNYARGLRSLGHEVDLIGPEECELFSWMRKGRSHRMAVGIMLRTLRALRRKKYDVVEFYGCESWLAVSLLARRPGRKFLLVTRSNGLETHYAAATRSHFGEVGLNGSPLKWYQKIWNPPIRRAFAKADGLVTVSHFDRDYALREHYQQPERVLALENPLPPEFMGIPIAARNPRTLGFCGSWLANKGIATIQTDVVRLLSEFDDCRFKLIGVGADFRKGDWFPSDLHNRIDVTAHVENKDELRQHYSQITILMVPSVFEGFGLVTAEGMACGCAVVATRTGFAAGVHEDEEIVIMDKPCPPYLYKTVKMLLLDESLRMRIAKGGHLRTQRLKWQPAIEELSETYRKWMHHIALVLPMEGQ
jgi:glycosyltransferase involved in cell wall biosynthesis